ncbi:MAG TPA: hypothetical protein VD969_24355 [Symbiobacteriaceae bacterium]|nr:hypothetical protein [Symbiobacteriaceae bacterium]
MLERVEARRYPPPGQWMDVGGYRLHLHCLGSWSPTVILDLHTLLAEAGVPAPYVLAGHSMGGLYARLFATDQPDTVHYDDLT